MLFKPRHNMIKIEDGVQAFYLNTFLRNIYMGMTVIFTPLFLYKITGQSLVMVAWYYFVERLAIILLLLPLSKVIERVGFRRSIAASIFFLIFYTLALIQAGHDYRYMWLSAILLAIQTPLYWISRDSVIAQDAKSGEMGRDMANLSVWESVATILGPAIGGLVVASWGYQMMFGVALGFLGLSVVPLWGMHGHTHKNGVSLAGLWYWIRDSRYRHIGISNLAMAVGDYSKSVIWPLIIFLRGINEKTLGGIFALAAVASMVVEYSGGRVFDRLRKKGGWQDEAVYALSCVTTAMVWVVRIVVRTAALIATTDGIGGLVGSVMSGFFGNYLHLGGKRMMSIAYWVYQEVVYSVGALVIFGVMIVGVTLKNWELLVLVFAVVGSLVAVWAAKESNMS